MLLILGAYALLTAGRLDSRSPAYQWMNVAGAAGFTLTAVTTALSLRRRST
jgi:hypothetical protein